MRRRHTRSSGVLNSSLSSSKSCRGSGGRDGGGGCGDSCGGGDNGGAGDDCRGSSNILRSHPQYSSRTAHLHVPMLQPPPNLCC